MTLEEYKEAEVDILCNWLYQRDCKYEEEAVEQIVTANYYAKAGLLPNYESITIVEAIDSSMIAHEYTYLRWLINSILPNEAGVSVSGAIVSGYFEANGQKQKLSKAIKRRWAELEKDDNFRGGCRELFPNGIGHDSEAIPTREQFLCALGDLKNKPGGRVEISTRPIDFFSMSTNATYSSCYQVGGQYFSGVCCMATCNGVLVATRYSSAGRKIGRCLLYVFPEREVIINSNSYGALDAPMRKKVREAVEAVAFSPKINWRVRNGVDLDNFIRVWNGRGPAYFDYNGASVSYNRDKYDSVGEALAGLEIEIPDCICINCGELTSNETNCHCSDCNEDAYQCCQCGGSLREDEVYRTEFSDGDYCVDCYDELFTTCIECDHVIYREDACNTETCNSICEDCAQAAYTPCAECGDYVRDEDVTRVTTDVRFPGDLSLCDHCTRQMASVCDKCGEYFTDDLLEDCLCPDCLEASLEEAV